MSEKTLKQEEVTVAKTTIGQKEYNPEEYFDLKKMIELIDSGKCLMLKRDPKPIEVRAKNGSKYTMYNYYICNAVFRNTFKISMRPKIKGVEIYALLESLFKLMPELPVLRERTTQIQNNLAVPVDKFFVKFFDIINESVHEIEIAPTSSSEKRSLVNMFDKIAPVDNSSVNVEENLSDSFL